MPNLQLFWLFLLFEEIKTIRKVELLSLVVKCNLMQKLL